MKNYPKLISEFYALCIGFYSFENGIYKIATKEAIIEAVEKYIESKPLAEIYFDSFDREEVRVILEPDYQII